MARVCLDLSPAVHQHAGLGRYAQELLLALAAADGQNECGAFYKTSLLPGLTCLWNAFRRSLRLKGGCDGVAVSNDCCFNPQHV